MKWKRDISLESCLEMSKKILEKKGIVVMNGNCLTGVKGDYIKVVGGRVGEWDHT